MTRRLFAFVLLAASLAAAEIPTPQSHFGHPIGQDRTTLLWADVVSYFQKLAASSDRIKVEEIGKTVDGKPMILATISAPENIKNLNRYRQIQQRLADPRKTSPAEAEKLIAEGKNVVLITCSIHATELASTHTAIEYVHKLLTEDTPKRRAILQNTIFLLMPSLNPDGVDIVTNWYRKTLGTPYEGTQPPELYHRYLGHDNNRDWYIFSQPETRAAISKVHNVWHPQIVYDVHQQGPYASRMFVPPWMDPIEPNVDPIIAQECNMIGATMASDMTAAGKNGVVINALYDFWSPARSYQSYHGGLRILSESASARLASPITVTKEQVGGRERSLGYEPKERSWNYLEPWEGGEWRLRDIIDYQLIAYESILYQAAVKRADMLQAFYRVGKNSVSRTSPQAIVIPAKQRDPAAAQKVLETLAFGMVEIERAPNGDYVIPMQQPYSGFAKTLLERQKYPDLRLYPGGPPKRPYDVTAHTLPLLFGVDVKTVDAPVQGLKPAREFRFAGKALAVSNSNAWREVNRIWKGGAPVWRNMATGDFSAQAASGWREIRKPRIGLYKSYVPTIDEGWTRWILEQFGFEYVSIDNKTLQAGGLRGKFDAILFADQSPATIQNGFTEKMPPEYSGGVGEKGATALKAFASEGGRLIFLNHACEWAVDNLGLKARNVLSGVSSRDFYSPGSLLNASADVKHPLALGMPKEFTIWSEGSPAWPVDAGEAVVKYPESKLLASGWLLGENYLANRAALLDVPVGQGRVILFGMKPQYRAQSYLTLKMLFNALVY